MHSDTPLHRHHWEMDFADVNTRGIRGFVDVCGVCGLFVTCESDIPPPVLESLWHLGTDFLDDSEAA